jgi:MFS family permease
MIRNSRIDMQRKFYGTIVWCVSTIFVVYSFCLNTAAAVFSGAIKSSLLATDTDVALAMGVFVLGFAMMQILAGYLLDNYNSKLVISAGIFLLVLGNFLISYTHDLLMFTLANFLQGLGAAFAFIAIGVLISQWFEAKLFPILFGAAQTVSCLSAGILHYYFILALKTHTWNHIYQTLAFFGGILLILSILLIKSPPGYQHKKDLSFRQALRIVIDNNQILLCALAAAMSFGVLLAYAGFWYLQVQKFYTLNNVQAVVLSGIMFAGIGIGTPLLGWISNLVKSRIAVLHITIVLGAMALLLGIYLPHYETNTLIIIKIISFLIGFFLSGSMLFYTVVSEISTEKTRGLALSVTNTAVFLFNALLMFLPYLFITNASKQFFTNLWLLPFFVLFSLLLLYFIKDTWSSL